MDDTTKKQIIIAGHGSLVELEAAKKLAEKHGAEIVVIDDKDDISEKIKKEFPFDEIDRLNETNKTYLLHNHITPELIKMQEEMIDYGLSNKQKNAVISPIRDSKTDPKIGRNEQCPCGSGLKYKKCCGR